MLEIAKVEEAKFNKAIESLFPELIKNIKEKIRRSPEQLGDFIFLVPKDNENVKNELLSICKYFNNKEYKACLIQTAADGLQLYIMKVGIDKQA